MGFINLGRLNIRKRNSCASALVSLSDVRPPSVYKSHILNGPINKLYLSYDIAIIQWITLCHKNRMAARIIITITENVCVSNGFSYWNNVYFEGETTPILKGHILNRIVH